MRMSKKTSKRMSKRMSKNEAKRAYSELCINAYWDANQEYYNASLAFNKAYDEFARTDVDLGCAEFKLELAFEAVLANSGVK
jgi:hypothetical protein